jgi:hypothetical protein
MSSLFLRQGFQESSSAGPFEDDTTMGMGKAPLVMIYESQFLEYQSQRDTNNPASRACDRTHHTGRVCGPCPPRFSNPSKKKEPPTSFR